MRYSGAPTIKIRFMNASNFNPVYVNEFANAKAFIEHYKTLDNNYGLSDSEMIAIYTELHDVQAPQVIDKDGVYIDTELE